MKAQRYSLLLSILLIAPACVRASDGDETGSTDSDGGGDGDASSADGATETTTDGGDGDTADGTDTDTAGDGDGDTTGDGDGDTTETTGDGDGGSCIDDGLGCSDNAECCGGFCYQPDFTSDAVCHSACIESVDDGECDEDEDCCDDNVCVPNSGGTAMVCQPADDTDACTQSGDDCADSSECCSGFCFPGGPNAGTCQ